MPSARTDAGTHSPSPSPWREDLEQVFADFLRLDVANGDPSADTVRGYLAQMRLWLQWCQKRDLDPAAATTVEVKQYRQSLVVAGRKPSIIVFKLTVLRQFYQAMQQAGLCEDNPAAGIQPPRNHRSQEDSRVLSEQDLVLLLEGIPQSGKPKDLRDRAIIALLSLHGLRMVEIVRANVDDLEARGKSCLMQVRGKGKDRSIFLRQDVVRVLRLYLEARQDVEADEDGTPLFAAKGNRAGGTRISRRGVRQMVDFYLTKADLKQPGLSAHPLRHTAATLGYRHSGDLRAVQDQLGHADPKSTSRYAHVVDREANNPASRIPVEV